MLECAFVIASYERFCSFLIESVKSFYDPLAIFSTPTKTPNYDSKVRPLAKSEVAACLQWFIDNGAVHQEAQTLLTRMNDHRNVIAHELPRQMFDHSCSQDLQLLSEFLELERTLHRWWVLNVEIPTDPDLVGKEVNSDEILGMHDLFNQLMLWVVEDDLESAQSIYDLWRKEIDTGVN